MDLFEQLRAAMADATVNVQPRVGGGLVREIAFRPRTAPFTIPAVDSDVRERAPAAVVEGVGIGSPIERADPKGVLPAGDGAPPVVRVVVEPGPDVVPSGATGDAGNDDEQETPAAREGGKSDAAPAKVGALVDGTASSTSVDFYGTEMSKPALDSMAAQFRAGIPYLPRHNRGMFGASIEWDEVIGRTIDAKVSKVPAVRNAYDDTADQYVLAVTSKLDVDDPMAAKLQQRLRSGDPIGQSIGGWFKGLQIHENEEGDIIRVVVTDVELDHLAVTRAPANPDSADLQIAMRSALHGLTGRSPTPPAVRADDAPPAPAKVTERPVSQRIEPTCARAAVLDGRVVISFDQDASDDALRDALATGRDGGLGPDVKRVLTLADGRSTVDAPDPATYAPPVQAEMPDARGGAAPTTTAGSDLGAGTSPENEDMGLDSDAITRAVAAGLQGALQPIEVRLAALEQRGGTAPSPTPAPAQAPAAPAADPELQRKLADAETRAKHAEDRLHDSIRSRNRSGSIGSPRLTDDRTAGGVFATLCTRARGEAPTLVRMIEAVEPKLNKPAGERDMGDGTRKSAAGDYHDLAANLADVLDAAVEDGLLTPIDARAMTGAGWR